MTETRFKEKIQFPWNKKHNKDGGWKFHRNLEGREFLTLEKF